MIRHTLLISQILLLLAGAGFSQQAQGDRHTGSGPARESAPLEPDFSATPLSGSAPLLVSFGATASQVEGVTLLNAAWDFGDGSADAGRTVQHTYLAAGTYSVTLTLDDGSNSVSITKQDLILVSDDPGGAFSVDFVGTPTNGVAPLLVSFVGSATSADVTGATWDFGDGTLGAGPTTLHTYTSPGTFDVSLSVTGVEGTVTQSKLSFIVVAPAGPSPFVLTNANSAAGLTNMFTGGGTGHSGGAGWVDYNNDFLPDLLISNGSGYQNILYRNDGGGNFTDVSSLVAKPDIMLEISGVLFGDIDNDGDTDVLMPVDQPILLGSLQGGPNLLYVNQGDGTFQEAAAAHGLVDDLGRRNICGGFADYDNDGFIDVYLSTWQPAGLVQNANRMYHNDGMGTFVNQTGPTGTEGLNRDSLVCLWFDADDDGFPDLYIGNVGEAATGVMEPDNHDVFLLNQSNAPTLFAEVTANSVGIGDDATASMGMDVGDVDNDGDWDLYITDNPVDGQSPMGNVLYLGNGDGTLEDNSCDVSGVCLGESTWPCNFADFDRDGWTDLWVGSTLDVEPERLYRNLGDGTFLNQAPPNFTNQAARGGTIADYDGDGDMDIVVVNYQQDSTLFRNDTNDDNHWIEIKLFGVQSNRDAIGALVRATCACQTQMRRVSGGDSAHSQMDLIMHFGLADQLTADLSVSWPSGAVQNFTDIPADGLVFIDENAGMLRERLLDIQAVHNEEARTLKVSVRSSFGGRTTLSIDGFGPLRYDASICRFIGQFTDVASNPISIPITMSKGRQQSVRVAQD